MSFLKNLFGAPPKQRTMLDDVQAVSGRLVVKGYRRIAAQHGCAPTAKTSDQKIIEIHTLVSKAFHQAAERRGERIPALIDNHIVLKFLQVYEMMGDHLQQHLQYEVEKYLAEGLRPDYKQELRLFDPDGNDPDVKRLRELHKLAREKLEREFLPKENKPIITGIEGRIKKAEAGDANEQFHLGLHYEQGQFGLPKDYFEAAKWYRKAAEQGHAGAQLYLGVFLCNVKQEGVEAYKWLELAKQGNDLDEVAATELQTQLVAHMTPEQIAEGQKLASEFVPTMFGSWGIKPLEHFLFR
jgi:hypothetical protein